MAISAQRSGLVILLASMKLFLFRERCYGPGCGEESHDISGSKTFQKNAALHLNLNSTTSGENRYFANLQNVAALAIINLIVTH